MNIGDILILRGKTLKGKNRIREHGTHWEIVDIANGVSCLNGSPGFLIQTLDDLRWIKQENDQDFVIVKE